MNKTPAPVWNVYVEDVNTHQIKTFNVFHSYTFITACRKIFRKYSGSFLKEPGKIAELKEEIRNWAQYSFWSKCEYEIVLTGWISEKTEKKIDVYDQLMLNWDSFFQYTYDHKAYFLRRKDDD